MFELDIYLLSLGVIGGLSVLSAPQSQILHTNHPLLKLSPSQNISDISGRVDVATVELDVGQALLELVSLIEEHVHRRVVLGEAR